ncbi:hypothetical protein G5714_009946 [Onychostoma macrolepis]|uniref:DDE Tnp4 domain-containing protein n=1 Tax=Onychostoma macrolepis TaxID=369639 RepID=A0A7J6CQS5_9TELE|nr:hypothetical protein G5714_009946 [Onychostoma macrolepis]
MLLSRGQQEPSMAAILEYALQEKGLKKHGFFLLGDSGYPCLKEPICLMTPFKEPLQGIVEARFNQHHARVRSVIERAFGMLKNRGIFHQSLMVHHKFAPKVVAACTILHNLCLAAGDEEDPLLPGANESEDRPPHQESNGMTIRARLAAQVSAPSNIQLEDHDYI